MPDASGDVVANTYGEITRLVERLHRRYLDTIRYELSKLGIDDINATGWSMLNEKLLARVLGIVDLNISPEPRDVSRRRDRH